MFQKIFPGHLRSEELERFLQDFGLADSPGAAWEQHFRAAKGYAGSCRAECTILVGYIHESSFEVGKRICSCGNELTKN